MYETLPGMEVEVFTRPVVTETDDLPGGGAGDKFFGAIEDLKRRFTFGKWHDLQEGSVDYGG